MPGKRAQLRDQPDYVLEKLEREERLNIELLREIVTRVCQFGRFLVGDPNVTRAMAIKAVDPKGSQTPYFFAVLTENHKGLHKTVGPHGFSLQVAFRKPFGNELIESDWVSDRFEYIKQNQIWWRNDLKENVVSIDPILDVIGKGRDTFL